MRSHFAFRSVGQGLFYTGSLNEGEYNFVYDCGTESSQDYIEREISEFVSDIPKQSCCNKKKNVDFVVISHLHKDHFSGLVSLMDHPDVHVKKIFLPYLGEKETNLNLKRLIIAYAVSFNENGNVIYDVNNYTLYNRLITLYEQHGYETTGTEAVFLGGRVRDIVNSDSPSFTYSMAINPEEIITSQEVKSFWEFAFFNRRMNDRELEKWEKKVPELENDKIMKWLKSSEGIARIKDAYEEVFGKGNKLNLSSTILAHNPNETQNSFHIYEKCNRHPCYCRYYDNESDDNIATVLTGDAEFDDKMLMLLDTELKGKHFGILQVPHHGSKSNWKFLKNMRSSFDCYVIPFGLGNTYSHPHPTVIYDMVHNEKTPYCASQIQAVRYMIEIATDTE